MCAYVRGRRRNYGKPRKIILCKLILLSYIILISTKMTQTDRRQHFYQRVVTLVKAFLAEVL